MPRNIINDIGKDGEADQGANIQKFSLQNLRGRIGENNLDDGFGLPEEF